MTATVRSPPPAPERPWHGRRARLGALLANTSLRSLLVAAFTALTIGAVGTVGLLSYRTGQEAVTILANQLLAEIGERVDQRLSRYLSGLRYIVDTNAVLIRQGRLEAGDTTGLGRHFAAQLGLFPGVDSIGLVTEQREVLMLARPAPDTLMVRRHDRLPPESLSGRLGRSATDPAISQAARHLSALVPDLTQVPAPLSFDFDVDRQRHLAQVAPVSPEFSPYRCTQL